MTDTQKKKKPWLGKTDKVEKSDRSEKLQTKTEKPQTKSEKHHSKSEKNQVKWRIISVRNEHRPFRSQCKGNDLRQIKLVISFCFLCLAEV